MPTFASISGFGLWFVIAAGVSLYEKDWRPFAYLGLGPVIVGLLLGSLHG